MNRKPPETTDKIEEEASFAKSTVERTMDSSDHKFLSFTQCFPPVAVCWVTLLLNMALRIYFTSVISENNVKLTAEIQQLKTERNYLRQQIQNMELNISRAQWSIDAYCRQKGVKQCEPCQEGWLHSKPSCYAYQNPAPSGLKTWEEAREDCRGKISDLAVIVNDMEKTFFNSWKSLPNGGFWIGLRVEDGRWQWVDGSELTETSWIQQPATDGHCAVFFRDKQWTSVNCSEKQQWICQKDALSV